jgi:competence protein ComEC
MMAFFSRPRLPLLGLALAAVVGIALADRWPPPLWLMVPAVLILAVIVWRTGGPWRCRIWVALAFASVHLLRVHHGPEAAIAHVVENRAQPVEIKGVVWSEPVSFTSGRGEPLANFVLRTESIRFGGTGTTTSRLLGSVRWLGPAPVYGDRVRFRGQAESLPPPRNPGEFDTAAWQRRRGVAFTVQLWSQADGAILAHGQGHWAERFAIASRA